MQDLVLREATDADVPAIVALIHSAFEEYRGKLDPPSGAHNESEEKVRQKMSSARVVVAHMTGEPCGCVSYEQGADHLSLSRLAVPPAFRCRGIGQALIAYVENRAKALSIGQVRLGVRITLARQRAYYERLGYRPIEYRAHHGYTEPTHVILEKSVHALNSREGK